MGSAAAINEFFTLPLPDKKRYVATDGANRGLHRSEVGTAESVAGRRVGEPDERLLRGVQRRCRCRRLPRTRPNCCRSPTTPANIWPAETDRFRGLVEQWFSAAASVARTLTDIFADALSLPPGYFRGFTDHSLDVLRMNNYALPPGEVTLDGDLIGMGEHTDYGIVTVLWADRRTRAAGTRSGRRLARRLATAAGRCWSTSAT